MNAISAAFDAAATGPVLEAALVSLTHNGSLGSLGDLILGMPLIVAPPFGWAPQTFVWVITKVGPGQVALSPKEADVSPLYASLRQDFTDPRFKNILNLKTAAGSWVQSIGATETFGLEQGDLLTVSLRASDGGYVTVDAQPENPGSNLPMWSVRTAAAPDLVQRTFFLAPTARLQAGLDAIPLATDIAQDQVAQALSALGTAVTVSVAHVMQAFTAASRV